jgi:hypothetical protein
VSEYAIVWKDTDHPHDIYAGGLTIDPDGVRLRGSAGRRAIRHRFRPADIDAVRRAHPEQRIAGFPSFRLDLRSGRTLLLASVTGVGVITEVVETLSAMLPGM